jgi:hypothetical protein
VLRFGQCRSASGVVSCRPGVATWEAQMRLLATVVAVGAVVLALLVAVRGRLLLGGRPVSPGAARVLGLGLVAMMLSVLTRIQLNDDRLANALGTLGLAGIIVALVLEARTARR